MQSQLSSHGEYRHLKLQMSQLFGGRNSSSYNSMAYPSGKSLFTKCRCRSRPIICLTGDFDLTWSLRPSSLVAYLWANSYSGLMCMDHLASVPTKVSDVCSIKDENILMLTSCSHCRRSRRRRFWLRLCLCMYQGFTRRI